jgi:hypothetical protein
MASISNEVRDRDTSMTRLILDLPAANADEPLPMLDRGGRLMCKDET